MTLTIKYTVNHFFYPQNAKKDEKVLLSDKCVPANTIDGAFLKHIEEAYNRKTSKGYGVFDKNTSMFLVKLNEYELNQDSNTFIQFTRNLMDILLEKVETTTAKGGKVTFIHYEESKDSVTTEYLLVAILFDTLGFAPQINQNSKKHEIADISNLRYAARINLTKWRTTSKLEPSNLGVNDRYISFINGKDNLSKYFKSFIGCKNPLVDSKETRETIKIISSFIRNNFDYKEEIARRKKSQEHLLKLATNNKTFELQTFINDVFPEQEIAQAFINYINSNEEYQISDGFIPIKARMDVLGIINIQSKDASWSISVNVNSQKVVHDIYRRGNDVLLKNADPESIRGLPVDSESD